MKRLIAAIAAAVLGVGSVLGATWTDSKGYKWTYVVNGSSSEITGVSSSVKGEVTIPPTLGGKNVSSIGESVFKDRTDVTGVTFPESLVSIGAFAFQGCTGLTLLQFPGTLDFIDYQAFRGCTKLETVIFAGDKAMEVVDEAFLGCSKLYTVYYNGSSIANWVMSDFATPTSNPLYYATDFYCPYLGGALTKLSVPAGVTRIGDNVFYLQRLDSVTIPDSVTSIGEGAFAYSYVDEVTIQGYSLRTIGKLAFSSSDFTSFSVPPGVTTIGEKAFSGCRHLSTVEIPESVTSIGYHAFALLGDSEPRAPSTVVVDYILSDLLIGKSEEDRVKAMLEDSGCDTTGIKFETDLLTYCIVNFDENGGAIGSGVQLLCTRRGGTHNVTTWDPPTWAGHEFLGWFTERTGGTQVTSSFVLKEKRYTFYAQWNPPTATTFTVTFGKNGGKGGSDSVQAANGQAMPAATAPTLSGWTFAGYWDTLALDEKGNAKGKQYYDANMKSVRAWDKTSATTLWAKWTNKVTLGKNGGTGGDSYVTCTKGQPMPKRTMPTKSGYVFDGYWTSTGAGGVKYYNADGTSAHAWDKSGSVTLWAKWVAAVQVKVTFGKNGGTGGDNYVTATTGQPMPTPRTAPTLKGWSFGGYWDTLACDAKGNPLGKQYYNSKMESVRAWDKTTATTLWAKWTVKVTLGKNGGTGGDSTVTVIKGQPFPKRTMPTKSGYTFGGYFVSASSKTGQCYNPDGTGTASMKWSTGGTPTIWALWTKTASCVELPPAVARRAASAAPSASAAPETAPQSAVSAGLYSGVLADGTGAFWLMLDEAEEDAPRTAYLYVASEDGSLTAECTAEEVDGILLLTTENGEVFAFDPAAGTLGGI